MVADLLDATPAQRLTARLGGTWAAGGIGIGHADCPVHNGPGLAVCDGDRAVQVSCIEGCRRGAIVEVLWFRGLWKQPAGTVAPTRSRIKPPRNLIQAGNAFLAPNRGGK